MIRSTNFDRMALSKIEIGGWSNFSITGSDNSYQIWPHFIDQWCNNFCCFYVKLIARWESQLNMIFKNHALDLRISIVGNLALSRALGDFAFKRNEGRRPEEQIITGRILFDIDAFNAYRTL